MYREMDTDRKNELINNVLCVLGCVTMFVGFVAGGTAWLCGAI